MSKALLDVNVLVALFDPGHPNHEDAHHWFRNNRKRGWATCPLTIHGCMRVLSHPAYPTVEASPAEVAQRLAVMCLGAGHEFWGDSVSLLDEALFRPAMISSHAKITDVYLLGLAVKHGGRLATFDRSIPWKAAVNASAADVELIGGGAREPSGDS